MSLRENNYTIKNLRLINFLSYFNQSNTFSRILMYLKLKDE